MLKKIISSILVALLIMQILPMSVFAEEINAEELTEPNFDTEIGDSYIIGEDLSLRDETTKHFRCSDGRYIAATYGYPVHYEKDGQWEELDFSLVESVDENGNTVYTTKEDQNYVVSVPEDIFSDALSYSYNGYKIALTYQGRANQGQENKTKKAKVKKNSNKKNLSTHSTDVKTYNNNYIILENAGSTITYEEVETDTDFSYEIGSLGIKEDIIVSVPQNNYKYLYLLETNGLQPIVESDNSIVLTDNETQEEIYRIEAPVMYDSAGAESTDIKIKLKEKQGCYELVIEADKKWINADDRVFPVTIDPTVRLDVDRSQIYDTYANQSTPSEAKGSLSDLYVGRNSYGLTRTYIKFEIPEIPENSAIVNACFVMYSSGVDYNETSASNVVMNLYDLSELSSWTESGLTWNNQPVSNAINGASTLTVIDYCEYKRDNYSPHQWDITKTVKKWYEEKIGQQTSTNNGIMIAASDETVGSLRLSFFSSNSASVSSAGYPAIWISYRNTTGLEDYWSYSSYSAGDAGTVYVNDYTGAFVLVRDDTSTYGQRMPVTVSHIYNSSQTGQQSGYSPSTGKGWQLSVQQSIVETPDSTAFTDALTTDYPYAYKDGDGTLHYLKSVGDGKYEDEDGLGITMTIDDSNRYVITDNNDNVMTFNSSGNIISIADANGNTMQMTYNNNTLHSIIDGAQHTISVTSGSNSLTQTAHDGRTVVHTYSSGNLTSVKLANGKNVTYTYDNYGRLQTATSSTGHQLKFFYYGFKPDSRLWILYHYYNDEIVEKSIYDLSQSNITTITSSSQVSDTTIKTEKQFDNFGRLICSYDESGDIFLGASNCTYVSHEEETDDTKHHISTVGSMGHAPDNLLLNSSFENGENSWADSSYSAGSADIACSTSQSLYGDHSLRIRVDSYSGDETYRSFQEIDVSTLDEGETYTASVYVKVASCLAQSGGGVFLQAKTEIGDDKTTHKKYASEHLTSSSDSSINNGWQRLSVTFTVPAGVTRCYVAFGFEKATGKAYFDAVQIEKSDCANDYNLIQDPGFENRSTAYWTLPSSSSDGRFSTTSHSGDDACKLFGTHTKTVKIQQTIDLKSTATETDTYVLSAWVKSEALGNQFHSEEKLPKFGIGVTVAYSDGTTVDNKLIQGNNTVSEYQYLSGAFTLDDGDDYNDTPVSITVYGIFDKQSNFSYFDDFYLAKEDVPSYTYNSKGNLVSATDKAKGNQQMSYSADGVDMTQYQNAVSDVYNYTYDDKHNLTTAISTNGVKYSYTYDGNGNVTGLTVNTEDDNESISSSISYDDNNCLVKTTTDAADGTTTYTYLDKTGLVSSVEDARHNTTSYTYDTTNYNLLNVQGTYTQKASMTSTSTKTAKAVYTYDTNNRLVNIKAKSNYSFTYDDFGNLLTAKAGDNLLVTNTYDRSTGALTSVDYGNWELYQVYSYDTAGRLTGLRNNGVDVGEWKYDGKDRVAVYNDIRNSQKHMFSYDALGRFNREAVLNTSDNSRIYASEYGYDSNNNVNKIGIIAGNTGVSMTYTYGADNLPSSYTAGTNSGAYTYDALNRLSIKTSNITPTVSYNYNPGTTMVSQEIISGNTTSYAYDANGNITAILTGGKAIQYQYDEFNRLTVERNRHTEQTTVYKYDAWGNIAKKWVYSGSSTWTPASTDLIKAYDYVYSSSTEGMAWKDLMTEYDGQTITYDAIGNPTSYMGSTMYWEGRTLVEQIKDGTTITYSYDSSDMRTSKTVGGVKHNYYYVEGKLMYEDCPSYKLFYTYDANGFLSGIQKIENVGFVENFGVHCNMFGDVIAIYDTNGIIRAKYNYDSWGKIISVEDAYGNDITGGNDICTYNSIRYRGYVYDEETGLYYLQSRYYDPETCRFINADGGIYPVDGSVNGYNLFAYCVNNPVIYADKTGNFPWLVAIIIGAGAIVGGILGANSKQSLINNVNTKKQNNNQNMKNPLINENQSSKSIVQVENKFFQKSNSSSTNKSEKNSIPPTVSVPELTKSDRIKNTIVGATLGVATAGGIVALGGIGLHFAFGANTVIGGATGAETFAFGALAFNSFSMFVAPFFGIILESIEWE